MCIFCKIINGEIPSYTLFEDDYFKVILDAFPGVAGHTIIISKAHAENIFELPDEYAAKALQTAKKVAAALKQSLNCDGLNILQNNGAAAGQTVPHFHIHVIPRFDDAESGICITWTQLKQSPEEFADLAEKIKNVL